ncbi:MAG: DUF1667 domain-containing protein [Clostridia bacterium]
MNTICIECPMGCMLDIADKGDEIVVTGHSCRRGVIYGHQEYTAPRRVITTLVELEGGGVLPVRTSCAVDKPKIREVLRALKGVKIAPPDNVGEVIIKNICGTDADIISAARYHSKS